MLCLLASLAAPSLAAPTRDLMRNEITMDLELRSLLDLVLGAAVMQGTLSLSENQQPDAALVEGVVALGIYSQALPYHKEDFWSNHASVTHTEMGEYAAQVFSQGSYQAPQVAASDFAHLTVQGMEFDLQALQSNPVIGSHVYATAFDGSAITLSMDLFSYYGDFGQDPETLPVDALTWLCNAQATVSYHPDQAQRYTMSSFSLSQPYWDGMIYEWQMIENTEYEYSVTLPGIFGLAEDAPACMVWQTGNGEATLTLEAKEELAGNYLAVLQNFQADAKNLELTENPDFCYFSAVGEGSYELHLVPQDVNWHYTLTLQFPPERQAEFILYAEFICNSLTAWGAANG